MSKSPCLCLTLDSSEYSIKFDDGINFIKTTEEQEFTLNDPILEPFFKNIFQENNLEGIPPSLPILVQ